MPTTLVTSVDGKVATTIMDNESNDDELINESLSGTGCNQFEVLTQYRTRNKNEKRQKHSSKTTTTTIASTTVTLKTEKEQSFEYKIDSSRLYPYESSICLDYTKYQGKFSLWRGMKDEIRILPIPSSFVSTTNQNGNKYDILIGLGSLSWSGGIYNCSPFCLYRKR